MNLALYDTAAQAVTEFVPMVPGKVGVYVCGATVQSAPHIGHLRPAVAFDILRRWLTVSGYDVTLIRNVTDIDDKILAKAAEAGLEWWAHANAVEREFTAAYDALNVIPPTYEPRATGHVPEMIELMAQLIDAGHAYATEPGNVWFDVPSWPQYGELTRQKLADLIPEQPSATATTPVGRLSSGGPVSSPCSSWLSIGSPSESELSLASPQSAPETTPVGRLSSEAAVETTNPELEKHSPYDFALWKAPRPGEPETAAWDTPWGRGRPGWHLECSAMAGRYLGSEFDIHGGGLDLRFPHHENEQAQSRAAGRPFARRWMHSAWITASGEKMSKSLGNGLLAAELLAKANPAVVRYAIAQAHYRSMLEWSDTTLTETAAAWERITNFVTRATEFLGANAPELLQRGGLDASGQPPRAPELSALPEAFVAAMNDDLNVPAALGIVHEHVRAGNAALSQPSAAGAAQVADNLNAVRAMLDVLGLDPLDTHWANGSGGTGGGETAALDVLIQAQLAARAEARAAKDWAKADQIRDQLTAAGVSVEDSPTGPRWTLQNG